MSQNRGVGGHSVVGALSRRYGNEIHWEFGKVLRDNFCISMYKIKQLEFSTWEF